MYIHVHVTLVWNDEQILPQVLYNNLLTFPFFFVCQFSIHCFILELQYNDTLNLRHQTIHYIIHKVITT